MDFIVGFCKAISAFGGYAFAGYCVYNIAAALVYGADKHYARSGHRRISEKTLLTLAALFGAPGAFVGMRLFHHKTKRLSFNIIVPLCLALQMLMIGAVLYLGYFGA